MVTKEVLSDKRWFAGMVRQKRSCSSSFRPAAKTDRQPSSCRVAYQLVLPGPVRHYAKEEGARATNPGPTA